MVPPGVLTDPREWAPASPQFDQNLAVGKRTEHSYF